MRFSLPKNSRLAGFQRPWLWAVIISVLLVGLVGWTLWSVGPDQPLAEASIAAKKLRLASDQYTQLAKLLASYHGVTAPTLAGTSPFAGTP